MYTRRLFRTITGIFIISILLSACSGGQATTPPASTEQAKGALSDITTGGSHNNASKAWDM